MEVGDDEGEKDDDYNRTKDIDKTVE